MARGDWNTNAAMIADIAAAFPEWFEGTVFDMTYGLGSFWADYRPVNLTASDKNPDKGDVSFCFRSPIPTLTRQCDLVVFDPPYRLSGTKDLDEFDERYGLEDLPDWDVPFAIAAGVVNGLRCLRPGGRMMVKVQDQQWCGKLASQTRWVEDAASSCGYTTRHRFVFPTNPRPQPKGRVQKSERSNYSTLLVLGRAGR